MGTKRTRQQKHEWFVRWFNSAKEQDIALSVKKLLAQFALETASTTRTGHEILQIYEDSGAISIAGDEIMVR